MDNAAFDDHPQIEAARILRKFADQYEAGTTTGILFDINGNKVGYAQEA
jgi:hypothetical protein